MQDRLGPRRYNGNDLEDEGAYDDYNQSRPHVLKRLGQPYNPWRTDQASLQNGTVGAGRSRGRYNGYQNYRNTNLIIFLLSEVSKLLTLVCVTIFQKEDNQIGV